MNRLLFGKLELLTSGTSGTSRLNSAGLPAGDGVAAGGGWVGFPALPRREDRKQTLPSFLGYNRHPSRADHPCL